MVIAGASNKRSLHTKRIVVVKVPQSFVHQCFYALLTQKPETERGIACGECFREQDHQLNQAHFRKAASLSAISVS